MGATSVLAAGSHRCYFSSPLGPYGNNRYREFTLVWPAVSPLLLTPIMCLTYPSAFSTLRFYWLALVLYRLAKVFEQLKGQSYALGVFISGHSLKHIAAFLVPLVLIRGFQSRQLSHTTAQDDNQITS